MDSLAYLTPLNILMALLGLLLNTLYTIQKAVKKNDKTPTGFRMSYLIKDINTWINICISILVVFIILMLGEEIKHMVGWDFNKTACFLIGFLNDFLMRRFINETKENLKINFNKPKGD